jgi:hypothetical protein
MPQGAKKPNNGRVFEELVALLERRLAGKDVQIDQRVRLPARTTKQPREFDVVLIWAVGHHRGRVAIEARDRSTVVGVPEVEAFHAKCEAVGITSAVIVSSRGFAGTARETAATYGMRCLDLKDAESFDWLPSQPVVMEQVGLASRIAYTLVPQTPLAATWADMQIIDHRRKLLSKADLRALVLDNMARLANQGPGRHLARIQFLTHGFAIRNGADGAEVPLAAIVAEFEMQVDEANAAFTLRSYQEAGEVLAQVAEATIASGPIQGDLFVVRAADAVPQAEFVVTLTEPHVNLHRETGGPTTFNLLEANERQARYQ